MSATDNSGPSGPQREPLGFFKPPKPFSEMTDDELEVWLIHVQKTASQGAKAPDSDNQQP